MPFISSHRILGAWTVAAASMVLYMPAWPAGPLTTVRGVVAGTHFTPPSGAMPSKTVTTYFRGARVCMDVNDNGACEPGEATAIADDRGAFLLTGAGLHPIVAEIPSPAASSAVPGADRLVFRAAPDAAAASRASR